MGPASVIQSQAGAPAQTHNAQSQQNTPSQPSVLQELLLNPSNQNNQTLNSSRPPYTTQYQTRLVINFCLKLHSKLQNNDYSILLKFFDSINLSLIS